MKIAFTIFRYFPFGGIQRDFMRIAELCAKGGHELHLFTLRWDGPPADFPLQVHIVPVTALRNHHRYEQFAERVRDELARDDYDLVVGFNKMPGLDAYFAGDPCFVHDAQTERTWIYRMTARYRHFSRFEHAVFAPGAATEILVIAEAQKAAFQRCYKTPENRLHLLPPSVAPDRRSLPDRTAARREVTTELGADAREFIALMIGSSYGTKGLARAIRALASLPDQLRRRTRLVVIGRGRPQPYVLLARALGVGSQVHLMGGRSDVPRFLAAADMLLHPSRKETAGIAIVEAIAAGLPVLVTAECGHAPHVARSGAGRVVPSPFRQNALNRLLAEMIGAPLNQHEAWRANAIQYAQATDLFSGPQRAVELIERFAAQRSRTSVHRSAVGVSSA